MARLLSQGPAESAATAEILERDDLPTIDPPMGGRPWLAVQADSPRHSGLSAVEPTAPETIGDRLAPTDAIRAAAASTDAKTAACYSRDAVGRSRTVAALRPAHRGAKSTPERARRPRWRPWVHEIGGRPAKELVLPRVMGAGDRERTDDSQLGKRWQIVDFSEPSSPSYYAHRVLSEALVGPRRDQG